MSREIIYVCGHANELFGAETALLFVEKTCMGPFTNSLQYFCLVNVSVLWILL